MTYVRVTRPDEDLGNHEFWPGPDVCIRDNEIQSSCGGCCWILTDQTGLKHLFIGLATRYNERKTK